MASWPKMKLEEVAEVIGGGTPSSRIPEYWDGQIPWLTPKDLSNFTDRYIHKGARNISELGLKKSSAKLLPEQTVLLTSRAPIGYLAISKEQLCTNQGFRSLVPDQEKIDPLFLFYLLQQNVDYLKSHSQGTTFGELSGSTLKSLSFHFPPLTEQKVIAHILGTIDDKIELNHRMNKTLEDMARALFKSWFMDFDPVHAKAEGRPTSLPAEISDLFPDELVASKIGKIPREWEVTGLSSQLSFVLGGDWGKANFSDQTSNRCFCIRGADIANLQCFKASDMPTRYLKSSSFAKRSLKPWDVVFEISGGSPTQTTGRTVLVTPELLENYSTPLTTSNFCRLLRFNSQASSLFHYYSFRSAYDLDEYYQYETGTTGIKNFGFKYYSEEIKYVLPSKSCLNAFSKVVTPMIKKSGLALQENEALSSLRDNLLPKLIPGQLRIPDAEKLIEKASV